MDRERDKSRKRVIRMELEEPGDAGQVSDPWKGERVTGAQRKDARVRRSPMVDTTVPTK